MVKYALLALILSFGLYGCTEEGEDTSAGADETGEFGSEDLLCPDASDEIHSATTIVLTVDNSDIDVCSVKGYVVGEQGTSTANVTKSGQVVVSPETAGEKDVILTAGSLATTQLTLRSSEDRGIRINGISVTSGERTDVEDVTLAPLGQISGLSILAQPTGVTDHAGIDVFIPGTEYSAKTDAEGKFSFLSLPPGIHNFYFEKDGYHRGVLENVSIGSGANEELPKIELLLATDGSGGLQIAAGAASVSSFKVVVNILPTSDAVLMKISEDSNFADASFVPIESTIEYTFTETGLKTLYIQFVNANGQNSSTFSDSIYIDDTGPDVTPVLNSGAEYTTSLTVTLAHTNVQDDSQVTLMAHSLTNSEPATFEAYAETKEITLADAQGEQTVYSWFEDNLGNRSGPIASSIIVDTVAPTLSSLVPADDSAEIAPNSDFTFTFSEQVSDASVQSGMVMKNGDDELIASQINHNTATGVVVVQASSDFPAGTRVKITATGITDLAGNPFPDQTFTFTSELQWESPTNLNYSGYDQMACAFNASGDGMLFHSSGSQLHFANYSQASAWTSSTNLGSGSYNPPSHVFLGAMAGNGDSMGVYWNKVWNGDFSKFDASVHAIRYHKSSDSFGSVIEVDDLSGFDTEAVPKSVAGGSSDSFVVGYLEKPNNAVVKTFDGTSFGSAKILNASGTASDVDVAVKDTDDAMAVYQVGTSIFFDHQDSGTWQGQEQILNSGTGTDQVSFAADSTGDGMVTWVETNTFKAKTYASGTWSATRDDFGVQSGASVVKSGVIVALDGSRFLVYWMEKKTSTFSVFARFYDSSNGWGTKAILAENISADVENFPPNVYPFGGALDDNSAMLVWAQGDLSLTSSFNVNGEWKSKTETISDSTYLNEAKHLALGMDPVKDIYYLHYLEYDSGSTPNFRTQRSRFVAAP